MSSGTQFFRTLAIGVVSLAIVIGVTRLVTDLWALLAVALVLQALLIGDRVWRHVGRRLKQRQQADWDAEWDRAWAEQDAQPPYLAMRPGSAGMGMRAPSQPFGIMDALGAARDVLEHCRGWHIVSIQLDTHDQTSRRYHLTVRHDLTGAVQFLHTPQDWVTFLRVVRESGQTITRPQPDIGRGANPAAR
jgi:hypothetical protein